MYLCTTELTQDQLPKGFCFLMRAAEGAFAVMRIAGGVASIQLLEGSLFQLPLSVSVRDVDAAPEHLLLESILAVAQGALGMVASCCTC